VQRLEAGRTTGGETRDQRRRPVLRGQPFMIGHLDNLLRDLLLGDVPGLNDPVQIRFEPPDDAWRAWVSANVADGVALNIYLVDLTENRKLRSNERVRTVDNGIVSEEPRPTRVDCHYLITAWSAADPSAAVEPPLDEHRLLADVTAVLLNSAPLNPSRVYPPGSVALNAVPELIRHADLPTHILPTEGFPKVAEFWGTMGQNHRWKPAIYLIVTLPVALDRQIAGPMVTTRITEYRVADHPETAEVWIQIGGHVLDATVDPPVAISNAWVQLQTTPAGEPLQTAETNALGRFTFGNLRPGSYQLIWRATGQPAQAPRVIEVPAQTGEYDLRIE
jgi:hypothetical protein